MDEKGEDYEVSGNMINYKMSSITISSRVGQAMINSVLKGYKKTHLENADINELA